MEQQILQEQKKAGGLAFRIAISFAIYSLIFTIVLRMMNVNPQMKGTATYIVILLSLLTWLPFIFAICFAQFKDRQQLGGFIMYGRAFSTGFKVAAYAGLFVGLFLILYYLLIDPAAIDQMKEVALSNAKNENEVKGIEMMSKYMGYFAAFSMAVMYTLCGAIISLIAAAVFKRDRPLNYGDSQ